MINQHVLPAARTTLCTSSCNAASSTTTSPTYSNKSGASHSGDDDSDISLRLPTGMDQLRESLSTLEQHLRTIQDALQEIHHTADDRAAAQKSRVLRLETMLEVRATVDAVEAVVPAHLWTLATYKELLFMDQHHVV